VISHYNMKESIHRYEIDYGLCLEITDRSDGELEVSTFSFDEEGNADDWRRSITEREIEYWIAHVLWWYDINDRFGWWSSQDVFRAAQACKISGVVLEAEVLMDVCGIQGGYGTPPLSYDEMKKRLTLHEEAGEADLNNQEFREGAD